MTCIAKDGLPDNRITCATCKQWAAMPERCRVFHLPKDPKMPRRCMHYQPTAADPDQRKPIERWGDLEAHIREARGA